MHYFILVFYTDKHRMNCSIYEMFTMSFRLSLDWGVIEISPSVINWNWWLIWSQADFDAMYLLSISVTWTSCTDGTTEKRRTWLSQGQTVFVALVVKWGENERGVSFCFVRGWAVCVGGSSLHVPLKPGHSTLHKGYSLQSAREQEKRPCLFLKNLDWVHLFFRRRGCWREHSSMQLVMLCCTGIKITSCETTRSS